MIVKTETNAIARCILTERQLWSQRPSAESQSALLTTHYLAQRLALEFAQARPDFDSREFLRNCGVAP